MINVIKKINQTFVDVILLVFYFIVIGFAKIVYIFNIKKIEQQSYWEEPSKEELKVYSAY